MNASTWRADAALRLFCANCPGDALETAQQIADNCCKAFGHEEVSVTNYCMRCGLNVSVTHELARQKEAAHCRENQAKPRGGKETKP